MGFFSGLFNGTSIYGGSKFVSGRNPGKGWVAANRFNKAKGGFAGGYGAVTFGNIINAHSSADEIVEQFGLYKDDNPYGCDAYLIAYQEEYDEAYKEYEDLINFYNELIELNENIIAENEQEIAECEQEIEELQEEIEGLQDDMEFADSPDDIMDIMQEIEELQTQIEELRVRIEELNMENLTLQAEIMSWHAEMELLSVEEFIDFDEVDKKAREYAAEFAQEWIDGSVWIPREVLDWAYYDVSDHNR